MRAWQAGALLCLALLGAGLFLIARLSWVSAQQAVVRVEPASQNVTAGSQFNVSVAVDEVSNLAAYEFTLQFDPNVVTYVSVSNGGFLGSSGRTVFCPGVILDVGTVRFGCATMGTDPGASGSGQLAQITFSAAAEGVSSLDLTAVSLSDPLSNDIPAISQNGSVSVQVSTPGPPTETPIPTPTSTPVPSCGATPGHAVACIQPPGQVVENGSGFAVAVVVNNVTNLGAYQLSLEFDPVVMAYVSAANGPFLRSSGRSVDCDPPSLAGNAVLLVCRTLGSSPPGPSGNGLLATITFSAVREGIGLMDFSGLILTDIQGNPLAMDDPLGGSVVVVPAPTPTPGPSPTPSATPTVTETPLPTATFTVGPSPTPRPTSTPRPTRTPTPTPTVGPTPTDTPVPGPATVRVAPASQEVGLGVAFTVDVVVDDVVNLGAFEFTLGIDTAVVQYVGAQVGPFLGIGGRLVDCMLPDVGGATLRMVCVTRGADPAGPSGSGVLATLTFLPVDMATTQVKIEEIILTDPMATVIDAGKGDDGSVTVGPAPTPTDTPLPASTDTPGPSPTPTITPTLGPPVLTPTATIAPGATAVLIDPASQEVLLGDYFTVDVMAQNVSNLGAYDFTLLFNPQIISYVSVSNGPFLGSSGRSVFCPAPIADGRTLRFGCVTTGLGKPGVSGSGQLAEIVFRVADAAPVPSTSPLDLDEVGLADPLGASISAAVGSGSVSVSAPGAASAALGLGTGLLTVAAVLTGAVGLLLRPSVGVKASGAVGGGRRKRGYIVVRVARDRCMALVRSLWERLLIRK